MNIKFTLFLVSLSIVGSHQRKLKITIFYESLCGDSRRFINDYLTPAIAIIGPYIDLEYIPYGKASHTRNYEGGYDFECQHGPLECYGNKVQACAIARSDSMKKTIDFIDCAMTAMYNRDAYEDQLRSCSYQSGINWNSVNRCTNSVTGSQLLARFGDITKANEKISFVPTVFVNDNIVVVRHTKDFEGFLARVCGYLPNKPKECYNRNSEWY